MSRKFGITLALTLGLLSANVAMANDAVLGALIGGGAGALVGRSVGGRDGTIIGGALGAAAGAAIGSENNRRSRVDYYEQPAQVYYSPPAPVYYSPPVQHVYYPPQQVYYSQPAVSYTHLDVYKRQIKHIEQTDLHGVALSLFGGFDGDTDRSNPVSYTHLDVYKRQIPRCYPFLSTSGWYSCSACGFRPTWPSGIARPPG